ncbi:MAG: lysophospholipid acyltransferase family protein [Planctomycetota bacterium]
MSKTVVGKVWYWLAGWTCRVFCLIFFRVCVRGKENIPRKGAFLLLCNHQSYLDPVFCGAFLRRRLHFVARDTLFHNWLFGWLITSLNAISVNRDKVELSTMREVVNRLREGKGVCLFPEGTRTRDGKIVSFKAGFGLLCRRGNAPIVPMVVDGAFESWSRYKRIFSPGYIVVWYGKAISVDELKAKSDSELAELVTARLRAMQAECRIRQGRKPYEY